MLPLYFLEGDYDYSTWIDGNMQITNKYFAEEINPQISKGFLLAKHNKRSCIYKEIFACQEYRKYLKQDLRKQKGEYRNAGYPKDNGLFACRLLAFSRDKWPNWQPIMTQWFLENLRMTTQD